MERWGDPPTFQLARHARGDSEPDGKAGAQSLKAAPATFEIGRLPEDQLKALATPAEDY
jgi:hypothetical protein